jgi:hypothetical protein
VPVYLLRKHTPQHSHSNAHVVPAKGHAAHGHAPHSIPHANDEHIAEKRAQSIIDVAKSMVASVTGEGKTAPVHETEDTESTDEADGEHHAHMKLPEEILVQEEDGDHGKDEEEEAQPGTPSGDGTHVPENVLEQEEVVNSAQQFDTVPGRLNRHLFTDVCGARVGSRLLVIVWYSHHLWCAGDQGQDAQEFSTESDAARHCYRV